MNQQGSTAQERRSPLAKVVSALPPGTQLVIGGTVLLGAASYIHLMAAGYSLGKPEMASVSLLWTILMSVGLGLFFPVEQELTRIVAARVVGGQGAAPVVRRILLITVGMLAVLTVGMAVAARPLADTFFEGHRSMVVALAASFAAMAAGNVSRGVLAGLNRFGAYGTQLAVDGGLRIALAVGCAVAGVRSPLVFALILAVAPLLAVLATVRPLRSGISAGPAVGWGSLTGGLAPLVASTLLSQVVVNAAVISTRLLAPDNAPLVAGLLNAVVLARVPLFVFGSLQASLLAGLSSTAAAGDRSGFSKLLMRTCGVVAVLGVAGGIPATILGPWLIQVLFKADDVLGSLDFLLMSAGTLFYMLAMVLGQALLVLHRHRLQLLGWATGTVALMVTTLAPGAIATRVCLAYTMGSLAAVGCMLAALWLTFLREPPGAAADVQGSSRRSLVDSA
ncbi:lipopolysaccharide biosynthesis protein [Kitasatospora sp. NPDC058032]|uniref:lipopolysaccharide biosynthesis protein n=1 Tax=Kitasatospora sp. NPDC058032 TaxID=3346307 RepID=UPI0036DA534A